MDFWITILVLLAILVVVWVIRNTFYKGVAEGFRSWGWRRSPPYGWPGWYRGRWDVHGADFWRRGWYPVVTWSPWAAWWPERTWVYDRERATPWDWMWGGAVVRRPWIYQREGFDNHGNASEQEGQPQPQPQAQPNLSDDVYEYPPDSPAEADIYSLNQPYRLLNRPGTCMPETISGVTSRSCYASDFQRLIERVGNYGQQTNNYKRGAPDSCTAPYHELVLSFYKAEPLPRTKGPSQ